MFGNPFKRKRPEPEESEYSSPSTRVVVDPNTLERLVVKRMATQQAPPPRKKKSPLFGGKVAKGFMAEVDRRNRAVFGSLLGPLVSGGIRAPGRLGEEVGGELARAYPGFERGIQEKFTAREIEEHRKKAFKQSPSYFHKQTWEQKTKPLLEKAGMGHIEFESYAKHQSEFDKILKEKLLTLSEQEKPQELSNKAEAGEGKPFVKMGFDEVAKGDRAFDAKKPRDVRTDRIE